MSGSMQLIDTNSFHVFFFRSSGDSHNKKGVFVACLGGTGQIL